MYLCYIDESGTPDIPGNTSHFVLAGISIPVWHWKDCEREINNIKRRFNLSDQEIHTAWILRLYNEQKKIQNFDTLNHRDRISEVNRFRNTELLRLQRTGKRTAYKQTRKNFQKTEPYIHLTFNERKQFIHDIATTVSNWGYARVFAECIDKIHFDPTRARLSISEQGFEQLVSRFETYLQSISRGQDQNCLGLLIHDNNETVSKKHTTLMTDFHRNGTFWTDLNHIIETPLFVDSQLTSMVQIADLCSYSIRRYLENGEEELFDLIYDRADRRGDLVVGVRHYSQQECRCKICSTHRRN